jgi:thioesterase domain-containing protein
MVRRLRERGEEVAALVLFDPTDPRIGRERPAAGELALLAAFALDAGLVGHLAAIDPEAVRAMEPEARWEALLQEGRRNGRLGPEIGVGDLRRRFEIFRANAEALRSYELRPCEGPLLVIEAAERPVEQGSWRDLAREVQVVPGDHYSILQPPGVERVAALLREALEKPAG